MFDPLFPLLLLAPVGVLFALLWLQRRLKAACLPRGKFISIVSGLWLLFAGGLAYLAWPLLFLGADDPKTSMYVQAPAGQVPGAIIENLTAIAHRDGFRPFSNSLASPAAPQNPVYLFEADSALVSISAQTQVLSREEAIACGYRLSNDSLLANDERQYYVVVRSIPFFSSRAQDTFAELREELSRSGYSVSPKPLPCQSPNSLVE